MGADTAESGAAATVAERALGFACAWGPERSETWSGTPYRLRASLAAGGPLVDLDPTLSRPVQTVLKAAAARRVSGRWVSMWKHGAAGRRLTERKLLASSRSADVEAVVMIQDLGRLPVPYFVVQDLSYDSLLDHHGEGGVPHFPSLRRADIERLRDRQLEVYRSAAALLPMSRWLGTSLIASGIPADRVFPVHPGVNVPLDAGRPVPPRRVGTARKLLFVGRDPHTKALDVVVAAFGVLRAELGPDLVLTVAGPPAWPFAGAVPAGVTFLGPVGRDRVGELMDEHDLFVMPSRLEGFGIAFVEALSRGLPCIGRNAFAMPEIIDPGVGGQLIDGDDPQQLAEVVAKVLSDDGLYERCAADAARVRAYYTWDRAAAQVRAAVSAVVR